MIKIKPNEIFTFSGVDIKYEIENNKYNFIQNSNSKNLKNGSCSNCDYIKNFSVFLEDNELYFLIKQLDYQTKKVKKYNFTKLELNSYGYLTSISEFSVNNSDYVSEKIEKLEFTLKKGFFEVKKDETNNNGKIENGVKDSIITNPIKTENQFFKDIELKNFDFKYKEITKDNITYMVQDNTEYQNYISNKINEFTTFSYIGTFFIFSIVSFYFIKNLLGK